MCTGNFIRNAAGHVVWSVDSMYAAPVDLHNARLVLCFGAKRGCVLQAHVKSAYLQALLGGNATWLKIPKSLLHLFPPRARSMQQPVVRLVRAFYGHKRAGSDWQLLKADCQSKGIVVVTRQSLHYGCIICRRCTSWGRAQASSRAHAWPNGFSQHGKGSKHRSVFRNLVPRELCVASDCDRHSCPAGIRSHAVAALQNRTHYSRSPEKG